MGYVLPVNHDQYSHYQRRTIRDNQNPFHIEKPFRVSLKQINRHALPWYSDIYKRDKHTSLKLKRPQMPETSVLYAQLTGKGRDFNQSV